MADNADKNHLDSNLLARSAARATRHRHLFAYVLERYLALNGMSEDDLLAQLRCDRTTLDRLRLCGRPDPDAADFAVDVQRVAGKFDLDPGTLASIVREVDAAEAFRRAEQRPPVRLRGDMSPFSSTPGMLRAARDHDGPAAADDAEPAGPEENSKQTRPSPEDDGGGEPGAGR